ncbi:MAG: hypothetical protein A3I26_03335 [Candidatus Yanofskybacteria bacterium RIFCSPLOWO2_02_FULL_43_10]|uniref:DUF5658 domain-containing protein n=1 Tax=Candidatus Yanofskybacteria bacterium RIFCSPLOWO2_12_FULL_43_11b TaxID=1802710 RepID=A0A1F8H878_9BACT|nr:MAG: hypothetical protein A2742_01325 [Candidatus Yanofskybacteria bacterium RIFCSPHIGHO2_01_FULL_43_32]OGN11979.1 MAG: hypothetical protein A3C69_02860 [Candidatus Yanofskybacteria bacterium RIFCSPHIGHO2_02_FULL_43_12]OGN24763.1 MAG: hypothetical protein A2923_03015 [Candidatus Yanofskybacteria bacterium RIFCSPLOWO2_01_FULL_43_46]OGN30185.1 MAG: hypothetical protein A3I26_03335 [Candidatus Yanofskybacteria bacterium RIFCSPLOWO2_02_FULL_43_10]OGN33238.1 MAG: hypothetical protein A3G51_02220 
MGGFMRSSWKRPDTPGNIVIVAFILVQCLDGALTYVGVTNWGLAAEANPVVGWTMSVMGIGLGLMTVKLVAVGLGIWLHLCQFHGIVAILTIFCLFVAVLPWVFVFRVLWVPAG